LRRCTLCAWRTSVIVMCMWDPWLAPCTWRAAQAAASSSAAGRYVLTRTRTPTHTHTHTSFATFRSCAVDGVSDDGLCLVTAAAHPQHVRLGPVCEGGVGADHRGLQGPALCPLCIILPWPGVASQGEFRYGRTKWPAFGLMQCVTAFASYRRQVWQRCRMRGPMSRTLSG
jgi:hypothetical protein